jgi:hypothetical protein
MRPNATLIAGSFVPAGHFALVIPNGDFHLWHVLHLVKSALLFLDLIAAIQASPETG